MGGDRRQPRPRNRRIRARLRAIRRQRTDISLEAAAALLGWSPSTLSRTENGIREITSEEVATIVTTYKLPAAERAEIIQDARADHSSGWWDRPLPGVPEEMGVLASYAAEANSLTNWAVMLIPGLLQIEPYAMALMISDGIREEDAQLRWVARKRRQRILGNVDYTAYIHEAALYVPFGGRDTHREQLRHLVGARERGIGVRIVPRRLPYGVISHSWLYMTFPNTSPVVNVEVAEGGVYLFDDQAKLYTARVELLNRLALSSMESSTLLRSLVKEIR
ncbi:helix-turn-helix domain-containing protein [Actinophytocola glycyrrhizae]|uniref:Helix-turn-helix domain-containing protein n=1 Tax=Actinophytocola glycyrrhizae TaxID=2044873 RepID=A0ABV9S1F5_9PSEU